MLVMYSIDVAGDTSETSLLPWRQVSQELAKYALFIPFPFFLFLNTSILPSLHWHQLSLVIKLKEHFNSHLILCLWKTELDTVDHSHLLETLFSFGLHDAALFLCYLLSFGGFPGIQFVSSFFSIMCLDIDVL